MALEAGVTSGFTGFGVIKTLAIYGLWFLLFAFVAAIITAGVIFLIIQKNKTKLYIINMMNKRLSLFKAKQKKSKEKGVKQLWVGRLNRFLPMVQQDDVLTKEKADAIIMLKDRNGLYHTARIPSYDEIKIWYKVIHNIDITKEKDQEKLRNVYLLPNPHEDLDWLAEQCAEANRKFTITSWWNSPVVAYIATGFICFMMIVVSLIIEKKL